MILKLLLKTQIIGINNTIHNYDLFIVGDKITDKVSNKKVSFVVTDSISRNLIFY